MCMHIRALVLHAEAKQRCERIQPMYVYTRLPGQTVSDEDLTRVLDRNPTCVDAYAIPASSNTSVHKVPLRISQYLDQHRLDL